MKKVIIILFILICIIGIAIFAKLNTTPVVEDVVAVDNIEEVV